MGLYERLMHQEAPDIPIHTFAAQVGEMRRLKRTRAQVVAYFNLTAAEETELITLNTSMTTNVMSSTELEEVLMSWEHGFRKSITDFNTINSLKTRLGV